MGTVALFTWHNGDCNCGQTLQAYALQKRIEELGCNCVIVDYIYLGRKICHNYLLWPIYRFYDGVKNHRLIKRVKFYNFINKYMTVSNKMFSYKQTVAYLRKENITNCLLGSDQIWNPQAGNVPRVMLLDYRGVTKCSYSPSMCEEASSNLYADEIKKIHEAIRDYKHIGVREENAKRMLNSFGEEHDIKVNLDPVFLLDADEWMRFLGIGECDNDYVFVYCLGLLSDRLVEYINGISNERQVLYVEINRGNKCPKGWKKVKNLDPISFVKYVSGASHVVGDSFHMVAFSIIFRKQFSVFTSVRHEFKPNMDRVTDLLDSIGLMSRFDNYDYLCEKIDYPQYEPMIKKRINDSIDFLHEVINDFG